MGIGFRPLSGNIENKIYKISPGLTLGRNKADFNLADKKASSVHAKVELMDEKLVLVDNNSRNGIWIGEERVRSVALVPGLVVRLGRTRLEVVDFADEDERVEDPRETWAAVLVKFGDKISRSPHFTPKPVGPLDPPLSLEIVSGRQMETKWTLGYGPRRFGYSCREFPIHEPSAPDVCFEIYPNDGPWFRTDHPDLVKLNRQEAMAEQLNDGDEIQIGDTVLRVRLIDEGNSEREPVL